MRPKRQRVALAFFGSVLLHGIALAIFALIVALHPPAPPPPAPEDEPTRLEIVEDIAPPVPENEPLPTPTPRKLVDANGPDVDASPSADALLADRTTRASAPEQNESQQAGARQAGRKMPVYQFDPRPPAPNAVSQAEPAPPTPLPQTAPALPQPDRAVRPAAPTPAPTAAPDEFAMAMATPTPPPEDPFDPSIRSTSPPLPKPAAANTPAKRAGALHSAENGSSTLHGAGGVDTVATPASRYAHQATQMIKAVWQHAVDRRDDQVFGTAIIHCTINKDGLVLSPRIVRNTADVLFGSIALQAVAMARLPPMPADAAQELDGKLSLDITFDLTPLPQEAALH